MKRSRELWPANQTHWFSSTTHVFLVLERSNFLLSMSNNTVEITPICEIQGAGLWSDLAGQMVTVKGVVTGLDRRGFFIQNVKPGPDPLISDDVYVYSPKWPALEGALLEVSGKVMDFVKEEDGKPIM